MKSADFPLGRSDFETIRSNKLFYIDKTPLIKDICRTNGTGVFLFTRPRRFGKTLNMSMLSYFFDISKDSRNLFEGLKISGDEELCSERMNKSPTVFVSFKSVDGISFDIACGNILKVLKTLFHDYEFLLESRAVNNVDKEDFRKINCGSSSIYESADALLLLVRMLYAHYGRKVVLLIDEYDVPMAMAEANGYYREMVDVMRGILQVLKDRIER